MKIHLARLGLFLASLILTNCSAYDRVSPIHTTFLEDVDTTNTNPNFPFEHSWVNPELKRDNYRSLFIKPVRTDKLPADSWRASMSVAIESRQDYEVQASEIAEYFRKRIEEQLAKESKTHLTMSDKPGPRTIVMELALTELQFSLPIARAAALVSPIPGTGVAMSAVTDPHVAFAARFSDGDSGKLLATLADRKYPPARILDLNKLTVTSSAREVCSLWAETIADSIAKGGLEKVENNGRFSLSPW